MARVIDSRPNAFQRRQLRAKLHAMQDGVCTWCGTELCTPQEGELDRIIPGKEGGKYRLDNLVLSCTPCNRAHGHAVRWNRPVERSRKDV